MGPGIDLDASPLRLLRELRGEIVTARLAHPEVLQLEVRDPEGGTWQLATQDARWSPADPEDLAGRSIEEITVDFDTGGLRCSLTGGVVFDVLPGSPQAVDDPPAWELIAPSGILLEFGPGIRWQISRATDPLTSRR